MLVPLPTKKFTRSEEEDETAGAASAGARADISEAGGRARLGCLTVAIPSWFSIEVMNRSSIYAALASIAVALPAAAQTPSTPGSIVRGGVVTLGAGSTLIVTPYGVGSASVQSAPVATTAGSGGGLGSGASSAGPVGARSIVTGNTGSASSARAGSGGSGSATGATSSGVPAWVLCPPSGALGLQPFLAGTDLSCAP